MLGVGVADRRLVLALVLPVPVFFVFLSGIWLLFQRVIHSVLMEIESSIQNLWPLIINFYQ